MQSQFDSQNSLPQQRPRFTVPHNFYSRDSTPHRVTTHASLPAALKKLVTSSGSWATRRAIHIKRGLARLAPSKLVAYAAYECGCALLDARDPSHEHEGFLLLTDVLAGRYGPQVPTIQRYSRIRLSEYYVSKGKYDLAQALLQGVAKEIEDQKIPLLRLHYHETCRDMYEHMGNTAQAWRHAQACYDYACIARYLRSPLDTKYAKEIRKTYFEAAGKWAELWPPSEPARFLNWEDGSTRTKLFAELMEHAREQHGVLSNAYQGSRVDYIASLCAHEFGKEALALATAYLTTSLLIPKRQFEFYQLCALVVFAHFFNAQPEKAITSLTKLFAPLDANIPVFIGAFETIEQALIEERVRIPRNFANGKRRFDEALAALRKAFHHEAKAKKARREQRMSDRDASKGKDDRG